MDNDFMNASNMSREQALTNMIPEYRSNDLGVNGDYFLQEKFDTSFDKEASMPSVTEEIHI
jgi:hypothetical protein